LGDFLVGCSFYIIVSSNGEVFHDILKIYSSSSSNNKKMFERMHRQHQMVFAALMVGTNTREFFNVKEVNLGVKQLVNQDVGV